MQQIPKNFSEEKKKKNTLCLKCFPELGLLRFNPAKCDVFASERVNGFTILLGQAQVFLYWKRSFLFFSKSSVLDFKYEWNFGINILISRFPVTHANLIPV